MRSIWIDGIMLQIMLNINWTVYIDKIHVPWWHVSRDESMIANDQNMW